MFRVLSIDNSITRANLTGVAIKRLKFGAQVSYALSVTQGLLYLAGTRTVGKPLPDIILLSDHLRDAAGIEGLRSLRDATRNDRISIVIISKEPDQAAGAPYLARGASAFIPHYKDPERYMSSVADTVAFLAMLNGLIPKQERFFPPDSLPEPTVGDVLQVYL